MRIGLLSDLNIDSLLTNPLFSMHLLADKISLLPVDMLFLNGNTSHSLFLLSQFKFILDAKCSFKVFLIPGLDELSVFSGSFSYQVSMRQILPFYSSFFNSNRSFAVTDDVAILPASGFPDLSFWTSLTLNELTSYANQQMPSYARIFTSKNDLDSLLTTLINQWSKELQKYPNHRFIFLQHFIPDFYFSRLPLTSTDQLKVKLSGSNKIGDFIKNNKQIFLTHFGNHIFTSVNQPFNDTYFTSSPFYFLQSPYHSFEENLFSNVFIYNTSAKSISFRNNSDLI